MILGESFCFAKAICFKKEDEGRDDSYLLDAYSLMQKKLGRYVVIYLVRVIILNLVELSLSVLHIT